MLYIILINYKYERNEVCCQAICKQHGRQKVHQHLIWWSKCTENKVFSDRYSNRRGYNIEKVRELFYKLFD